MDYVKAINELAGIAQRYEQPGSDDWGRLERELGLRLPSDYNSLVSDLGSGWFGLDLMLRNPAAKGRQRLSKEELVAYREMVGFIEELAGVALFPRKGGLVLIGGIGRQHLMLGPSNDGEDYSRLFLLDHDYDEVHGIKSGVAKSIYDLYNGNANERWAVELRGYVWGNFDVAFFTAAPSRG
jgi:hypothetical protein